VSYLIDTHVLSELRRRAPEPRVVAWRGARPTRTLHLSVLTLGELRKGIEPMEEGERKRQILDWLEAELPAFFLGRVVPVDTRVADAWGRIVAKAGRPVPAIDSLIAATALAWDLTLVTRNTRDFAFAGVPVVDPWTQGAESI
jgi:toxin FitB